jgi:hypothetical protein
MLAKLMSLSVAHHIMASADCGSLTPEAQNSAFVLDCEIEHVVGDEREFYTKEEFKWFIRRHVAKKPFSRSDHNLFIKSCAKRRQEDC